jgi:hypothetical protein
MNFETGKFYRATVSENDHIIGNTTNNKWCRIVKDDLLLFLYEKVFPNAYDGTSRGARPIIEAYFLIGETVVNINSNYAKQYLEECMHSS